jgi:hypothetical protein
MTEPAGVETQLPRLVHSGTYALYETPGGGRHLVYRQTRAITGDGTIAEVDSGDLHLPDFPPEALPLIGMFCEHGIPLPVLALLRQGKSNPLKMLGAIREAANGAG